MGIGGSGHCVSLIKVKPLKDVCEVTGLIDMDCMSDGIVVNLKSHIIIHGPVCNLEHALKVCNDRVQILSSGGANDPVVDKNPNDKVDGGTGFEPIVHTGISVTGDKIVEL